MTSRIDRPAKSLRRRRANRRAALAGVLAVLCVLLGGSLAAAERWLLVDTASQTLQVMEGELALRSFANISIGRNGVSRDRTARDDRTPLGAFRVLGERERTRFHRFFPLDYPSLEDARRAHRAGRIDDHGLAAIRSAHEQGLEPPSWTALGGNLGIHGVGEGDARIHEDYNWTDGCIALTNGQIDELASWIRPGMIVVIR